MNKEAQPLYISTVKSPLVPICTIMGQELYVELRGHTPEERDRNFAMVKSMMMRAFDMPPEVPPVEVLPFA